MEYLSVQEIVKNTIDVIPGRYLADDQESAAMISENQFPSIPIFDMKNLLDPRTKTNQLAKFHTACKDWGIFQLVNHGVESRLVDKMKHEIHEFYKLPLQDKLRYRIRPGDFEGYGQKDVLSTDGKLDWGDRFYMITNPICKRRPHLLPDLPSSLRETLEDYMREQQNVARAMLRLIAEALKIDGREMEEMFEDGMQSVRMSYYPPCPEPDKVNGLRPHSDASGITILLQANDVEGFQIKNRDGVWMPVKFLTDALVVNLGDIIEIISNGVYKSVEHRAVVNSEKERISVAMFFNPNLEAMVGPLPSSSSSLIIKAPVFRTMKADQYVKEFFSRKLHAKSFLNYMKA